MNPATLSGAVLLLALLSPLTGMGQEQAQVRREANRIIIEGFGTETAPPDLIHLMMKMESRAARAADAISQEDDQLRQLLAAVDQLKIPNLTYEVKNNVLSLPPGLDRTGIVYTRNIIFSLAAPPAGGPSELDQVIAKLEDLGARHNSHCVTCIGSG